MGQNLSQPCFTIVYGARLVFFAPPLTSLGFSWFDDVGLVYHGLLAGIGIYQPRSDPTVGQFTQERSYMFTFVDGFCRTCYMLQFCKPLLWQVAMGNQPT